MCFCSNSVNNKTSGEVTVGIQEAYGFITHLGTCQIIACNSFSELKGTSIIPPFGA